MYVSEHSIGSHLHVIFMMLTSKSQYNMGVNEEIRVIICLMNIYCMISGQTQKNSRDWGLYTSYY